MWTLEALSADFDVTVYTRGGFDLFELNRLAGTNISPAAISVRIADFANRFRPGFLAHAVYLRSLRAVGAGYDLRITASGVMAWGLPAIHFISSPGWDEVFLGIRTRQPTAGAHAANFDVLEGISVLVSQRRKRSLCEDIFVSNSKWTSGVLRSQCPGRMQVIYPAVPTSRSIISREREDAVLVFGRLSPEKRIESCIRIVEAARNRGFCGRLVIAGPPGESDYAAHVAGLCAARREWVELLPAQTAEGKAQLLGRMRYGLSACGIEAFGIATAEMAAAGMLVVVPSGCGQTEIVTDPRLHYETEAEAADKLVALQNDSTLQIVLMNRAADIGLEFSPDHYIQAVRRLAFETLGEARRSPATRRP